MRGKGKPFQKGNKVSQGKGRPRVPSWLLEARKLTHEEFQLKFDELSCLPVKDLKQLAEDPEQNGKTAIMCNWILAASHDSNARAEFLNRTMGKLKETHDHNVQLQGVVTRMSDDDLLEACKEAIKVKEQTKRLRGGTGS